MNILDLQNKLRNLSEEQLIQQMQAPTGEVPQFLVLSEITRRQKMQTDLESRQGSDGATVAQDAIAAAGVPAGFAGQMAGAMAPQTDMQGNTGAMPAEQPQMMPQEAAPVPGMAGGGIVALRDGGRPGSPGTFVRNGMVYVVNDQGEEILWGPSPDATSLPHTGPGMGVRHKSGVSGPITPTLTPEGPPPSDEPFRPTSLPHTGPGMGVRHRSGVSGPITPTLTPEGPPPSDELAKQLEEAGWEQPLRPPPSDELAKQLEEAGWEQPFKQDAPVDPEDPEIAPPGPTGPSGGGIASVAGAAGAAPTDFEQELLGMLAEREKRAEQDKWLALAQFGLQLMSSKEPTLGGAIGEAGGPALDALRSSRETAEGDRLGLLSTLEQYRMGQAQLALQQQAAAARAAAGAGVAVRPLPSGALTRLMDQLSEVRGEMAILPPPPSASWLGRPRQDPNAARRTQLQGEEARLVAILNAAGSPFNIPLGGMPGAGPIPLN